MCVYTNDKRIEVRAKDSEREDIFGNYPNSVEYYFQISTK